MQVILSLQRRFGFLYRFFILPNLLPSEKEFVQKNEWKMTFLDLDWRLNDLTGGRAE